MRIEDVNKHIKSFSFTTEQSPTEDSTILKTEGMRAVYTSR